MDTREDFERTWLMEMPTGLGNFDTFDNLEYNIKDRMKYIEPISVSDNIWKMGDEVCFYWFGTKTEIILGAELHRKPQGLIVAIVGKNPKYKGKPPYASSLYDVILKDTHKSLRIFSDTMLSNDGYNIWKKLFQLGYHISVYDNEQPGKTFKTFDTEQEMDDFFEIDNNDFKRYQYVLSESGKYLGETRGYFNTRRYRELAGVL